MDTHLPVFLPSPSPRPASPNTIITATQIGTNLKTTTSATSSTSPLPVPASEIDTTFSSATNLSTTALNARILSFSDEFFAPASNLLTPTPPVHRPGVYVHTGAWYDGWETRRHNPKEFDWVVIRLGCVARVTGVEVDTGFFVGNHAERAGLEGCFMPSTADAEDGGDEKARSEDFEGWKWILHPQECGPGCRQAWIVPPGSESNAVTHLRLRMYPDGGIARLRVYGHAIPPPLIPANISSEKPRIEELSAALNGAVALSSSDQHFGVRSNLLLPGRGVDMGDGWETKRSREKGHVDWVVVKLGLPARRVSRVVVDTKDFRGNFPQKVRIEGLVGWRENENRERQPGPGPEDEGWRELVKGERRCWADREHVFEGEGEVVEIPEGPGPGPASLGEKKGVGVAMEGAGAEDEEGWGVVAWTHVKMTIIPDGGVKRLRVFGERA